MISQEKMLKEVIKQETEWRAVQIKDFRFFRAGISYATMAIDITDDKELSKRPWICTYWRKWKVREFITPGKCLQCMVVGHVGKECQELKATANCHRCGEEGHQIKECKGTASCHLCHGGKNTKRGKEKRKGQAVKTNMTIMQIYLNRCRWALDLIYQTAREREVDMLMVAESNKDITKTRNWMRDTRADAAILITGRDLRIGRNGKGEGFCWAEVEVQLTDMRNGISGM